MPRKERTPASRDTNRENQRRSRARHREFVDELQRRVVEYERRDAQASLEMQSVARAVAEENEGLREMLAQMGVGEQEIQSYLASRKASMKPSIANSSGLGLATGTALPSYSTYPASTTVLEASMGHKLVRDRDSSAERTTCADDSEASVDEKPADGLHCLEAASILAQIRGQSDPDLARAALGCAERSDCVIRNTDLFQLMDEMS